MCYRGNKATHRANRKVKSSSTVNVVREEEAFLGAVSQNTGLAVIHGTWMDWQGRRMFALKWTLHGADVTVVSNDTVPKTKFPLENAVRGNCFWPGGTPIVVIQFTADQDKLTGNNPFTRGNSKGEKMCMWSRTFMNHSWVDRLLRH